MSFSCGAVIVETRPVPDLDEIIDNHVKLLPKDWGVMVIKDVVVNSLSDYNRLLTSKAFWDKIPFDKILIFQSDSRLLRTGIEEFLDWDYVGAPWKFQDHGGNGGLSLRSKEAMLEVIKNKPYHYSYGYEDVYFCNALKDMPEFKLAPREVCDKFSCETIFKLGTIGIHSINRYLTKEQCELILNQYN